MMSLGIKPIGKPRMTRRDVWKKRPVVERYHAYCDELRLLLPHYRLPQTLNIIFFLPMPASWSKKKRAAMKNAPHDQKPDVDNLVKGFMDAFKQEDKHVYSIYAQKLWSDRPGIVLGGKSEIDEIIGQKVERL